MAHHPAWLLHFVKSIGLPPTSRTTLITVKKLESIDVVHFQARVWAMEAGAESWSPQNQDGVHYLGPTYWLASG